MSDDALLVQQGSLYASLHRLTREGLLTSEWRDTEHARRARFYVLTPAGHARLAEEVRQWQRLSRGVTLVVEAHA